MGQDLGRRSRRGKGGYSLSVSERLRVGKS